MLFCAPCELLLLTQSSAVDLYTPDIVRLQLYLLHSDVFPALDDYFSGRSRFSDSDRRPETPHSSLWFTSLTLAFHELVEEHSEENDFEPHRKVRPRQKVPDVVIKADGVHRTEYSRPKTN